MQSTARASSRPPIFAKKCASSGLTPAPNQAGRVARWAGEHPPRRPVRLNDGCPVPLFAIPLKRQASNHGAQRGVRVLKTTAASGPMTSGASPTSSPHTISQRQATAHSPRPRARRNTEVHKAGRCPKPQPVTARRGSQELGGGHRKDGPPEQAACAQNRPLPRPSAKLSGPWTAAVGGQASP